jgi:hypothetical protein
VLQFVFIMMSCRIASRASLPLTLQTGTASGMGQGPETLPSTPWMVMVSDDS